MRGEFDPFRHNASDGARQHGDWNAAQSREGAE